MEHRGLSRCHEMPFGASLRPDGGARFRLWAPSAQRVDLSLRCTPAPALIPMQPQAAGWYECEALAARAGDRYVFRINDALDVPDPASRFNPDDVHGASMLVDPRSYRWGDGDWRGRPWQEAVIYELHVGTFTQAGTFAAAIERLDHLVKLGVTAIELMPVADFPGRRGWGYDGVLLFAPDATYGRPDELKTLIDAAHARGLMVLLDVVYNHFGPDGNYLHTYARPFFNELRRTPWGAAVNFDGDARRTVRDFYIHNALFWLDEYHFDGLRLDAVHAIVDGSRPDIIEELTRAVHEGTGRHRRVHIVLENDRNDARYLSRSASGSPLIATAQWNDDVHHAAHVIVTGECDGYYADYAGHPVWLFGRALAEGFGFQGEPSPFRDGAPRGESSVHLPPGAFVDFLQTHDQVGNRALGERIEQIADADALAAVTACVLLAPTPPLLFMGEEFAASSPFLYFCDFHGELAEAVTRGRRAEFGRFERFRDERVRTRIPDPNDPASFARSKLDWGELTEPGHARWLDLYRTLLRLRRERLVRHLAGARNGAFHVLAPGRLAVDWPLAHGSHLHLLANLDPQPCMRDPVPPGEILYASHPAPESLVPWSVRVSLETRDD